MLRSRTPPRIVYGLADPRTGHLRYVGMTEVSLRGRVIAHLAEARANRHPHPKSDWLRSVNDAGLYPDAFVIEEGFASAEEHREAERFWIRYFSFIGCNLTNRSARAAAQEGRIPIRPRHDASKTPPAQRRAPKGSKGQGTRPKQAAVYLDAPTHSAWEYLDGKVQRQEVLAKAIQAEARRQGWVPPEPDRE